jgi:hypothetical protein
MTGIARVKLLEGSDQIRLARCGAGQTVLEFEIGIRRHADRKTALHNQEREKLHICPIMHIWTSPRNSLFAKIIRELVQPEHTTLQVEDLLIRRHLRFEFCGDPVKPLLALFLKRQPQHAKPGLFSQTSSGR